MRIDPPWSVGIADCFAEDYPDRSFIKAWVWCDRLQWMCIAVALVELGQWLV